MSGGVDSSVAAALLKKEGYEVVGVFFKPWSDSADIEYCNWREDRQDAMRVAAKLGIKFKTWDFSKEYGKLVTKYMIDSYRAGITPNPDVMCNKEIKFGLFLKKALSEGASYISTGHYARLSESEEVLKPSRAYVRVRRVISKSRLVIKERSRYQLPFTSYHLLCGLDKNKDQSYFLYNLTQKELKYCLFPIGSYTKPEVRKLAKKFGLPNHAKHDSQGVCFVGQLDMKEFLEKYIKPKSGDVKLISSNKTIGQHDGVYYYTIGQRHGLNLGIAGGPYFVVKKDLKKNIIYVSDNFSKEHLDSTSLRVKEVNWINKIKLPVKAGIQIRYRSKSVPAVVKTDGSNKTLIVTLKRPIRAVTAGQSAVFYKGSEILGGGIII